MKKVVIFLLVAMLGFGNAYSQTKKAPVKRTQTSVAAKQKAEAEAKAAAEAEAKAAEEARAKAEAEKARLENNEKCSFSFDKGVFLSRQNYDDFVIYEIPDMSASDLKGAVFTALSSMYKSPKDVITSLSDNMIQLEGYAVDVYYSKAGEYSYGCDLSFNIIVQFKDGKVRYNVPTIKQIYIDSPLGRKLRLDMTKPLSVLIDEDVERYAVEKYFKELIESINTKLEKSNDW